VPCLLVMLLNTSDVLLLSHLLVVPVAVPICVVDSLEPRMPLASVMRRALNSRTAALMPMNSALSNFLLLPLQPTLVRDNVVDYLSMEVTTVTKRALVLETVAPTKLTTAHLLQTHRPLLQWLKVPVMDRAVDHR
jgi:hypothetical protein